MPSTEAITDEKLQEWLSEARLDTTGNTLVRVALPTVIRELQATRAERETMREQCVSQIEIIAKLRDEGDRLLAYSDHHKARTETAERELQAARKALAEHEHELLEQSIARMGWPEIHAFRSEMSKGQSVYEDAGGYMMRGLRRLFGLPQIDEEVVTYQKAAKAMVARAALPPEAAKQGEDEQKAGRK